MCGRPTPPSHQRKPGVQSGRAGYPHIMRIARKLLVGLGHATAIVLATVTGYGATPWLRKKLREEGEQTGRLV